MLEGARTRRSGTCLQRSVRRQVMGVGEIHRTDEGRWVVAHPPCHTHTTMLADRSNGPSLGLGCSRSQAPGKKAQRQTRRTAAAAERASKGELVAPADDLDPHHHLAIHRTKTHRHRTDRLALPGTGSAPGHLKLHTGKGLSPLKPQSSPATAGMVAKSNRRIDGCSLTAARHSTTRASLA